MSRKYKNIIKYGKRKIGKKRREELVENDLKNTKIVPETLLLEDYDTAFKEWTEKNVNIVFESKEIPTVSLFASQRFTEYMQSWRDTDDKKNFLMNFKVITRDNNPKQGTMYGDVRNVPENRYFLTSRIDAVDGNGRPYFLETRMRQPFCVDIRYSLSVVTNKFRMLNMANELINARFKSIYDYLTVKGHNVSMVLDDISDESEYQIDDRQYFSQTYTITVRGYIIREEDYQVVEAPKLAYSCFDTGTYRRGNAPVYIEETDPCEPEKNVYGRMKITVALDRCAERASFKIDVPLVFDTFTTENVKAFRIFKNGEEVFSKTVIENEKSPDFRVLPGDEILIDRILKENLYADSAEICLYGYNPYEIYRRE